MSTSTVLGAQIRERRPSVAHGVVLITVAVDAAILAAGVVAARGDFVTAGWQLPIWVLAVATVGAVSLSFESGSQLGLDMPLLLAAGFIYGPVVAGALAVVGYVDPREFKRQVPVLRALFNRAQTSLSVMAGTFVYLSVVEAQATWPRVLLGCVLAVGIDCCMNYGIVAGVSALHDGTSYPVALSRLRFGTPLEFGLSWAGLGLLSLTLASSYEAVGAWALITFAVPLLLVRQSLSRSEQLDRTSRRLSAQSQALRDVGATIADERRDERLSLAAGLHDEVLPPLYQVHLMSQVLRQDLATGKLLALEEDLPELLRAADRANESMRGLIRGLQTSPLGSAGLPETLRLLVDYLGQESGIRIRLATSPGVHASTPISQLLIYQVAREALRNAVAHSRATTVTVWLGVDDDELGLVVEDDGIGFLPAVVDRARHFGLELMRERVELAGGVLRIESSPGDGTRVVARVPSGRLTSGTAY